MEPPPYTRFHRPRATFGFTRAPEASNSAAKRRLRNPRVPLLASINKYLQRSTSLKVVDLEKQLD
jgi:hypothetical protein